MPADREWTRGSLGRLTGALIALLVLLHWLPAAAKPPVELWDKARNGDVEAQYDLGLYYLKEGHEDHDPGAARYWLEQAGRAGSHEAAADFGILLLELRQQPEDFSIALEALAFAADGGVARAQYEMANLLANGLGVLTPDPRRARALFQLAAGQGHAPSKANLGVFYYEGIAGEKSVERAESLFREAAEAGDPLGQYHLGVLYLAGHFGEPDFENGLHWIREAVKQKLPQAQLALGQLYLRGQGVPESRDDAITLVRLAAASGLPEAQFQIGVWSSEGAIGEKDESAAVEWYQRAAEQGMPDAQYLLGNHLATGRGVGKDLERAIFWLEAAARSGHPRARDRIAYFQEKARKEAGSEQEPEKE